MLDQSLYQLRNAFRDYARTQAPDIASFCGKALHEDHQERAIEPHDLPATRLIAEMAEMTCEATMPLYQAILQAMPLLRWRQSYTSADPGINENYLAKYGWFNLIAPSGPFVSDELRLSVGYWGKGLTYPIHWHEPEEIYLTIAGSALYVSQGRQPVRGGPGTTICHYSNQPHSAQFDEMPLLAAAFWRGGRLEELSVFEDGA